MEDRFVRGFAAGAGAGVLMNLWSYLAGQMGWTTLTMGDWAGIIILAHTPPFSPLEYVFSLLCQVGFAGTMGVPFAYLLPLLDSRHHLFKGWVYSLAVWFLIYAVASLFRVAGTVPLPLKTALSNIVSGTIYGLALPALLQALEPAAARGRRAAMLTAAAKPLAEEEETEPE